MRLCCSTPPPPPAPGRCRLESLLPPPRALQRHRRGGRDLPRLPSHPRGCGRGALRLPRHRGPHPPRRQRRPRAPRGRHSVREARTGLRPVQDRLLRVIPSPPTAIPHLYLCLSSIRTFGWFARKIGLLAVEDLLCLLIFSAIGRLSHGLPVLDAETFKTAYPFIAGWLLSAYSLSDLVMMPMEAMVLGRL